MTRHRIRVYKWRGTWFAEWPAFGIGRPIRVACSSWPAALQVAAAAKTPARIPPSWHAAWRLSAETAMHNPYMGTARRNGWQPIIR